MTRLSITHPAVLFAAVALCALALAIRPPTTAPPSTYLSFHGFLVAPRHLAIALGLLFAFYAGVYGLFPKFFGRNLSTPMAQSHFWLSFLATLAAVISWIWANRLIHSAGMADSTSLTVVIQSRQFLALALTIPITVLIFLLAQAIFVFNLVRSLLKGSEP